MVIKEVKPEKEFKAPYLKDYREPTFEFDEIPWVNEEQLIWDISVNWDNSTTTDLQNQINSLDSRVSALENP